MKKNETSTTSGHCPWADRAQIERLTGGATDDEIWNFEPFGTRLVVVRRIAQETTAGGIIIPSTVRDRDTLTAGTGYVASVGPECSPGLLGKRVVFEAYCGAAIGKQNKQGENIYESRCIILTEGDIWGMVHES